MTLARGKLGNFFQIGLIKSDIRELSRPKVKFKDDFPIIFNFILPFLKASSQELNL